MSAEADGSRRLRVLAVLAGTPSSNVRRSDGYQMIAQHLLEHLVEVCDVSVVHVDGPGPASDLLARCDEVVRVAPLGRARSLGAMVLRGMPLTAARDGNAGVLAAVQRLAVRADVVYLHGISVFPVARRAGLPVVANEIDPLSLFWRDRADGERGPARWLAARRASQLERLERRTSMIAAAYVVVNPADAIELGIALRRSVETVPNGVRPAVEVVHVDVGRPTLSFVGTLDYAPNVESVRILVDEVLPLVAAIVPDVQVVLAGRRPTPAVLALAGERVTVLEDVPDVMDVLARSTVAAFPGGFGRGTRNSVLEALRAGRPVVASTASARGLSAGPHLAIADDAVTFAHAVTELLTEPRRLAEATDAAVRFGDRLPTWADASARYLELLVSASTTPAGVGQR